jgi:hypothetical protein
MRLGQIPEEVGFAKWQLDVGHGRHTDENGNINLPSYFSCPQNTVESLIDTIYPGISLLPHPPDHYFVERVRATVRATLTV